MVKEFISKYFNIYYQRTYSFFGEDRVLKRLLDKAGIKKGFYVDVGAYHPTRFSNTALLYKKGWRGLNIDANSMKLFNVYRRRDWNYQGAVSNEISDRLFYKDKKYDGACSSLTDIDLDTIAKYVITRPLKYILEDYSITKIDVLNIDVEGHDYEVLLSHNWDIKPKFIMIECRNDEVEEIFRDKCYTFLKDMGYKLRSINLITLIWELK